MNRKDYVYKIAQILKDASKFQVGKSSKYVIGTMGNRVNKQPTELLKKELIDNSTYNNLQAKWSELPFIYSFHHVHKFNIPLRSIVSMVDSLIS